MSTKASESQRERWRRYRAMEKQRSESFRTFVSKHQQRGHRVAWHDDCRDRLLVPGEIWDETLQAVRKASTLAEEKESALMFVRAMRTEGVSVPGLTLRDLLRRVFNAWCQVGQPLLNPATGQFSLEWERQTTSELPRFEDRWEFLDPVAQYDEPLFPTTAPTAEQKFNAWARDNGKAPKAFFSSRVMPHAGDE
jgi:hypothetical protein